MKITLFWLFCLGIMEHHPNRCSYLLWIPQNSHEDEDRFPVPWPVTKDKAMNIHSNPQFNEGLQRTNIHHTFFCIQKYNFRCPDTLDVSWESMSLFVGQGKSIQRHKANVQLFLAIKRQSRHLRTMDNKSLYIYSLPQHSFTQKGTSVSCHHPM
jgi:hypothetical protein